jgi:lipid-A-disaccharide synthase-like uncharacterized protein
MFANVIQNLGGYLHQVFVLNLDWVVMIGLVGQLLFTARFVVQWIASERVGKSVIPVAFWFLSIGGGLILLAYALYRRDPVFIVGQSLGVFIYVRNLMLVNKERKQKAVTQKQG